jgi:hypothetical protein
VFLEILDGVAEWAEGRNQGREDVERDSEKRKNVGVDKLAPKPGFAKKALIHELSGCRI